MARRMRMTMNEAFEMYIGRKRLDERSLMLVRYRVAIQILERLYRRVARRIDWLSFPAYVRAGLAQQAQRGKPHILAEEIEDLMCELDRGGTYHALYARAMHGAAQRVIGRVKYSGRRDQQ